MSPYLWFSVGAVSRYVGPAFAVILFPAIGVLGITFLRLGSAAAIFAIFTKPWTTFRRSDRYTRYLLLTLGSCLATMNTSFYLALERLPVSTVAGIEFMGIISVAFLGIRTIRNLVALGLVSAGVLTLVSFHWKAELLGIIWATLNASMFAVYLIVGHKLAEHGGGAGIDRIGVASIIAVILVLPLGFMDVGSVVHSIDLLAAGIAVGICSSVIPYACDQMAMSKLPREAYAVALASLPGIATIAGAIVLAQIPSVLELFGLMTLMLGIALHSPAHKGRVVSSGGGRN